MLKVAIIAGVVLVGYLCLRALYSKERKASDVENSLGEQMGEPKKKGLNGEGTTNGKIPDSQNK